MSKKNNFNENMTKFNKIVEDNFNLIKDKGIKLKESIKPVNLESTLYQQPWYFGLLELLQYGIFIVLIYKYNPFNIVTEYPAFTNISVLLVSFLYVALFYFLKESISQFGKFTDINERKPTELEFIFKIIKTLGTFIIFIFITLGIVWLFKHLSILTTLLHHSLLILIIISTLSIIYILSEPLIKSFAKRSPSSSVMSFLWNFIMFIPCLFIRFMEYIKEQNNLTTKPVWMLLIFEVILIVLWILVPLLFHTITTHDGKQLLSEPKYLNEEHTLGNFENLHADNITKDNKFKYRYSLSAWFYINPQPPNTNSAYTKYTSILNYGNKPNVQYNGKLNSIRIMTQSGKSNTTNEDDLIEIFETKNIIYQKWNNIVINYDGGTMDIFLNGELVSSRDNILPYMTYENVKAGTENGIHGGICNVTYYNSIMKKSTILLMYKLLRDKKIPLYF
jgi:hypothetical protein